jgi:hypothetical protein
MIQNDRTVAQKLAKIGFVAWCVWLVIELGVVAMHLPGQGASRNIWAASIGGLPMIAGGCVLAWFLAKQPNGGLAVVLVILCVLLLCKFYLSEIIFEMSPRLGGYTFSQSVSVWWSNHTARLGRFLLWFPPMLLLIGSLVFYPIYSLPYNRNAARAA